MSEQVSALVRDELKLARLETTRKDKQTGPAPAFLAAAGRKDQAARATPPVPQEAGHSVKTDIDEIKEKDPAMTSGPPDIPVPRSRGQVAG
jgi:hypothetical protein